MVPPSRRMRTGRLLFLLILCGAAGCASRPSAPLPRDQFPLDPREGLAGPFDAAVERGWRALLAGDTERAENEFARASGPSKRPAEIGTIEALVLSRRSSEAQPICARALGSGRPTIPLLTSCGEASARVSEAVTAYELYERAAAMAPERPGISARAAELREAAADEVLDSGARDAAQGRREAARSAVARAIAWSPGSARVLARAAEVECEAGDKERALGYYREAIALGATEAGVEERAGELAMETGDYEMAVSVFESLAAKDPRFGESAASARLAFRIANWPEPERRAARARRLTRAGGAGLAWWMFPEVREAKVTSSVVATDVLERRDSRAMMRAVALSLLDVDPYTHRARPDLPLYRAAAARMLLGLAAVLRGQEPMPECLKGEAGPPWKGAEAIRVAAGCGLLSESGGPVVSGAEFTRGLDRLRSLVRAGEAEDRD